MVSGDTAGVTTRAVRPHTPVNHMVSLRIHPFIYSVGCMFQYFLSASFTAMFQSETIVNLVKQRQFSLCHSAKRKGRLLVYSR